jgi:carboxymethylenebutenolidase
MQCADLSKAIDDLANQDKVMDSKVGVVGFSIGGQIALYAACQFDQIGACVDFYGYQINTAIEPEFGKLASPVLGFFGGKDKLVTPDKVNELKKRLAESDRSDLLH